MNNKKVDLIKRIQDRINKAIKFNDEEISITVHSLWVSEVLKKIDEDIDELFKFEINIKD